MMEFSGVRMSWLTQLKKKLFAFSAEIALSRSAFRFCVSSYFRSSMFAVCWKLPSMS